jgi:hypothetical protein
MRTGKKEELKIKKSSAQLSQFQQHDCRVKNHAGWSTNRLCDNRGHRCGNAIARPGSTVANVDRTELVTVSVFKPLRTSILRNEKFSWAKRNQQPGLILARWGG